MKQVIAVSLHGLRRRLGGLCGCLLIICLGLGGNSAQSAEERFGPITVGHQPMVNGQTHHGYFEHRFQVSNAHESDSFEVTVSLPNASHGSGNVIHKLSRTVTIGPLTSIRLVLLQPPLMILGNNRAQISINGRAQGELNLSRGYTHMTRHSSGGLPQRTMLVSRSLNSSALDSALRKTGSTLVPAGADYSPGRATGKPDVKGSSRSVYDRLAWLPARSAGAEWLELQFATPMKAEKIRIIYNGVSEVFKDIRLHDDKGGQVASVTVTNTTARASGKFHPFEITFPLTPNPVRMVRINMDTYRKGVTGIDAVELIGGGTNQWAKSANASSSYGSRSSSRRGSSPTGYFPEVMRSEFEVGDWSDHWLAYSAFDAVMLNAADFKEMPPQVVDALWRYVETGGALFSLGEPPVPASWQNTRSAITTGIGRYQVGFGSCFHFDARQTTDLDSAQLSEIQSVTKTVAGLWPAFGNERTAQAEFSVIANLTVPVRGVAFIMLLFIVIVGPINIFVLARINKRIWLLWTVPAISLVTCGIVFTYSLVSEGIIPSLRAESITLLDHESRRATSLGRLAYYSPLTLAGGLEFGFDTELFPIVERNNYRSSGTPRVIDWTKGQNLRRGWIAARVPSYFAVRKSEVRRERIDVERQADGRLAVVNGLGAAVTSINLVDRDGQLWESGRIQAGGKAVMALSDKKARVSPKLGGFRSLYESRAWFVKDETTKEPFQNGRAGTYMAILDSAPFMEHGMDRKAKIRTSSIVFGLLNKEELAR